MIYKDLCVATDKYTDHDGKERKRWLSVGVVCYEDNGNMKWMKMFKWFNPAGLTEDCYLNIFERKTKESTPKQFNQSYPSNHGEMQSDIPF